MTSEGKSSRAAGSSLKPAAKKGQQHRSGGLFALDREQSARLMLMGAVTLVVAIAVAVIAVGYYISVVKPRSRTVLQVDDTKVSYDAMVRRMAYEYFQNVNYQRSPQLLANGTYQTLLDELTKVNRAPSALSVEVTPDEFDKKFRARVGVATDADQKIVSDAAKVAFEASGLTEAEYRRVVMAELIDGKIKEKYKVEAPANAQQAKVEVILVRTEDDARAAIARITAGEDFATVAKEMSAEPDVATTGGVHPYAIKDTLNLAYEDYAFSAEPGKLSDPIASKATSGGFYVVEVVDRSDQPVTDGQKSTIANQKLSEWLKQTQDDMQAKGTLKTDFDAQSQSDALSAVDAKIGPKVKATQSAGQRQQISQATAIAALTANPATPVAAATSDGSTPAAAATDQSQTTPVVPAQPIAPDSNGQ
jgi:hypothetical protein